MGPCMCGGCRRCLHDQGVHCGDENCRRCNEREPEPEPDRDDQEDWREDF